MQFFFSRFAIRGRVLRKPPCPVIQSRAICIISRAILAGRTASLTATNIRVLFSGTLIIVHHFLYMTNKSAVRIIEMRVREFVQWARYRHPQRVQFA